MLKLTPTEKRELLFCLRTVVSWHAAGPYGDGENITDKRGFATIKRLLTKLDV